MLAIADAAGMASPMPLNVITNLTPASGKPPKSTAKSKGKSEPDRRAHAQTTDARYSSSTERGGFPGRGNKQRRSKDADGCAIR